jgi:GNAT superfamily N-acetyltransferase
MTPHIRSGQQSDVVACVKIISDWVDETPWHGPLVEHQEMVADWSDFFESELVWVAEIEDRIVGFCTRSDDNIGALYVAIEARNTGIGKRLLNMVKVDRDWITVWVYEENKHARKFYQREGLIEVSREIDDESNLMNVELRWTKPN